MPIAVPFLEHFILCHTPPVNFLPSFLVGIDREDEDDTDC